MEAEGSHKFIRLTFAWVGSMSVLVLASAGRTRAATWTQKADMPTARFSLSTCLVDGKIYAIGGVYSSSSRKLEEYDPVTDTWTQKADMPTARVFVAGIAVGGKIYVIGGETHWDGGTKLSTVEAYDPATDTWTPKADMPTPRNVLGTSVVDGRIYAIGGGSTSISLKKVEVYDPTTDTWTEKADMPTGRKNLSTSVFDGKIYAIGGGLPNGGPVLPAVEAYDPATDTWTEKADMPAPRSAFDTSVVGDKIYAFGGTDRRGGAPLSTLFRYDPATDTWTTEQEMPVRNLGMSASVVGRRVYIIGGTSTPYPYGSGLSTLWEFIPLPEFDFNEDGIVDAKDVSMLVDHWYTDEPRYDLAPSPAGDGIVDVQDLVLLSEHLFEDYSGVAHWKLDETEGLTAYDSFGANDAYVVGNPVWVPDGGQVGGTIQLDGVDDYLGVPFVLNPGDGPFSVFAWIQGGGPGQVIVSQFGGKGWLLVDADGALITNLRQTSRRPDTLSSQVVITDGSWHHVGLTWDGATRSLYVDDALVAEDAPGSMPDMSEGLNIGCGANLEARSFFSGLIDDVRIYNRAVRP